jgi:hypothetical protein
LHGLIIIIANNGAKGTEIILIRSTSGAASPPLFRLCLEYDCEAINNEVRIANKTNESQNSSRNDLDQSIRACFHSQTKLL